MSEHRSFSPWTSPHPPRRVLVIRFHALGDVALMLPAAVHLAQRWPGAEIDILTCAPADSLAESLTPFHRVYTMPGGSGRLNRFLIGLRTGLSLRGRNYDLVMDIQRNAVSRLIRLMINPASWSEFDRYSPRSARDRVLSTIALGGVAGGVHEIPVPISEERTAKARDLLVREGWDGSTRLVVFNPAGLWETRNWPLEGYVELYRLWSMREPVRILVLGTDRVKEKGAFIARQSGTSVINLAGKTTPGEALAVLQHAALIVTEDSGLMHMAWAAGVPIVALFGSSRSDWSAPGGNRAVCMDSSDLECGCCMKEVCRFGDIHCLTRRSPQAVLDAAIGLLERNGTQSQPAIV
jgi:heptosyltransferase II